MKPTGSRYLAQRQSRRALVLEAPIPPHWQSPSRAKAKPQSRKGRALVLEAPYPHAPFGLSCPVMNRLFKIARTVRTYRLYFADQADVLEELLESINTCLGQVLPLEVSRQIDREGSRLVTGSDGRLGVELHPRLREAKSELSKLGLFRVFLPQDVGGFGLPLCIYYLAGQLVSYFDTSLALVLLVHGNAMYAIDRYGTETQRQTYLPRLASGELMSTVAFTEPSAGSDAGAIRMRAVRDGDSYVLTGAKQFITHGGDADVLVTSARTGPTEDGIRGVSTFIVEREVDGVDVLGLSEKTGLNGSPTANLSYDEVRIPSDRLLGREGEGGKAIFAGVGMTRVNIGAQALGIAKRAFNAAVEFALEREQGGCRIVEHDAIQQRLSRMAFIISAMENLVCLDSYVEHQGLWHVREMSIAKYYASERIQELTQRAINVFGGYGACTDYAVERCRREAVALPLYGGTSEIQWFIIARELMNTVEGTSRADYGARDDEWIERLHQRCQGDLTHLARRVNAAHCQLWAVVERVCAEADPAPYYRHLTDFATALSVAQVLLFQASGEEADDLDRELAVWAVDLLEDQADRSCARIETRTVRRALKGALRDKLE